MELATRRARGGPKPNPLQAENEALRRRLACAEAEVAKTQKVIEVQGTISVLLSELVGPGARSRT